MDVHFTDEQEAQLAQIAGKTGVNAEHLVKSAVLRLLEDESNVRGPAPELTMASRSYRFLPPPGSL